MNSQTWWTNGLLVDSANAAKLAYRYLEADGSANLDGAHGAVRFWFSPDWNGGTGTGAPGYWFELGDVYAPGGGWALVTDPSGTGLSLVSGSNGLLTTYLTAPIGGWVSNTWHQVALSYSSAGTVLFLDGAPAASGPVMYFEPDLATRLADGFTVGSDPNGSGQAGGVFDELATFNCPLSQSEVTAGYPYPAILSQPASESVVLGTGASFSVTAASPQALSYQWTLNGTNIAGATGSTYAITNVQSTDLGSYAVVISNGMGSVTSSVVMLSPPIQFTVAATNQHVNLTNAPLQLTIQCGTPYYWAVMLDSTNFSAAGWNAYTSSNITANLGTNQGWHTVWVGLAGLPASAPQVWNAIRLDLDLTPPALVVTSPTNLAIPLLQLQGCASEQLAGLTFDLSNAGGAVSNQTGFMTGGSFNPNTFLYTNEGFKCFDLALANGANTVTLHAADLAGNVTNRSFVFNLNVSNKPAPGLQLYWPQDGAQISGSSFTWRGVVDDPTAILSAVIADSNGNSNVVAGVVERNGNFWVDNLPLAAGTNTVTLTATDINNHATTNTISVVQSSVALAIYPVVDNLNQLSVCAVEGTIDNTNYAVWVNGVEATNYFWYWIAYDVPVNGAGSAVFQARAIPYADHNGNGTVPGGGGTNSTLQNPGNPDPPDYVDAEMSQDKPPAVICLSYHQAWKWECGPTNGGVNVYTQTIDWSAATGGSSRTRWAVTTNAADGSAVCACYSGWYCQWDTNGQGTVQSEGLEHGTTNIGSPTGYTGPTTFAALEGQSLGSEMTVAYPQTGGQSASTELGGGPGGRSTNGPILCSLAANAQRIVDPWYPNESESWDTYYGQNFVYAFAPLDPQRVSFMGRPQGTDGQVWVFMLSGEVVNLGMAAPDVDYLKANAAINTASLTGLTVVSNSATQINASTNWVAIKTNGGYVTLQASMSTTDTDAAADIQWTGGEPVPGQPLQRQVSKSVATNVTVTASVGLTSFAINVWIFWGTWDYNFTNSFDTNDVWASSAETFPNPTYAGIFDTNNGSDDIFGAKVEMNATFRPTGILSLIATNTPANGFLFKQYMSNEYFAANPLGGLMSSVSNNPPASTNYPYHQDVSFPVTNLNVGDNLLWVDIPSQAFGTPNTLYGYEGEFINFFNYVTFGGTIVSDVGGWYTKWKVHYAGTNGYTQPVNYVGPGTPAFPTNWGGY